MLCNIMIILEISQEQLSSLVKTAIKESLELNQQPKREEDVWFNLQQLCNYLPDKPAKPTVYGWVSKRSIPHHKKGKSLSFLKSEIDQWLKDGLRLTEKQIQKKNDIDTDLYLALNKTRRAYVK